MKLEPQDPRTPELERLLGAARRPACSIRCRGAGAPGVPGGARGGPVHGAGAVAAEPGRLADRPVSGAGRGSSGRWWRVLPRRRRWAGLRSRPGRARSRRRSGAARSRSRYGARPRNRGPRKNGPANGAGQERRKARRGPRGRPRTRLPLHVRARRGTQPRTAACIWRPFRDGALPPRSAGHGPAGSGRGRAGVRTGLLRAAVGG